MKIAHTIFRSLLAAILLLAMPYVTFSQYGPYTNATGVSGTATAGNTAVSAVTNVAFSYPMIGLGKTASISGMQTNGTYNVTYTFTIKNMGNMDLSNVRIADTLTNVFPSPMTYTVTSITRTAGNNTIIPVTTAAFDGTAVKSYLTTGTLVAGGSATISLVINVTPNSTFGIFNNSATVTAQTADATPVFDVSTNNTNPDANNNGTSFDDNTPTPVTIARPDIAVTKTVDNSTPQVGSNVTFTITLKNVGVGGAINVTASDLLPAGYLIQGTPNASVGSYNSTTGVWTVSRILPNAAPTLTITAKVLAAGPYTNTASSNHIDDIVTTNNSASVTPVPVPVADLQITKTASSLTPNVTSSINFTLAALNNGLSDATNVVVKDTLKAGFTIGTLPSGVAYDNTTRIITWTIGAMAYNTSASVIIPVTVNPNGAPADYINTAVIAGDQVDNNTGNNKSTVTVTPVQRVDLVMEKTITAGSPLYTGDNVTFNLKVTNNGPSNATNVKVADPLKSGYTYVSNSTASGSYDNNTGNWTIGNLAAGASATLTITAKVKASGAYDNTATATSTEVEITPADNTASTTAPTVLPRAELQVVKTVDNATPYAGSNVVFTLTATNNGPSAATGVKVSDQLPTGYTFISAVPSADYNSSTGEWTIGSLANGASTSLAITAKVLVTGNYLNSATISGNEYDDVTSNNTSTRTTTPVAAADLSVSKTADNSAPPAGSNITFTIVATNNGPSTATNVTVTDALPAGYSLVSATATQGSYAGSTWTIGSLANGATTTLTIVAKVNAAGSYINTATITGTEHDGDLTNNTSTASPSATPVADISVVKTPSTSTPDVGSVISFEVKATNNGPSNATAVVVTDLLKSGYTFVSATATAGSYVPGTGKWTIGALANGSFETLTITATVNATGDYSNTAVATNPEADNNTTNNTSTVTPVPVPVTDLKVQKVVSAPTPYVGDNVQFTVTVTNDGPSDATGVTVDDLLKSGYAYVSYTATAGSYVSSTGKWNIGNLAKNGTATLTITAKVNKSGDYSNKADVTGNEADRNTANNTSTVTTVPVPVADLAVTKTVTPTSPNAGSQVTFTIGITNNGPSDATNAKVTDQLPIGYTYVSSTATTGAYSATTNTWTIGNLANGASASLQIVATVNADKTAIDYTNTATASATETDNTPANNTASATTTPVALMDLQVTNTPSKSAINIGEVVTYTVVVTNNGPSNATGVKLTDLVSAGFNNINYTIGGVGTVDPATGVWTIGNLASGASVTLTITAKGLTPGTYTTPATVVGTENETTLANNTASATVQVYLPPTAVNDSVKTHINVPVDITVLSNDTPGDGAIVPSTVNVVSGVANGTLNIDPVTGKVTYTPNNGYYGTDIFTYNVKDANGAVSNTATVKITIGEPPLSNDDAATTNPNTPVVIDLLANDVKRDLDIKPSLTAVVTNPSHGTVTIDPVTGKATYTPNPGYFGTDVFTYLVRDINGIASNISTVTITVNKPPTAVNDAASTNPNTPIVLNTLGNDVVGDAALVPSTVTIVKQPDHGTVTIDPVTGKVTYTPNQDYFGTDTYTYTVKDANGAISNVATGTITVNKPPTAVNDAAVTNPNTPVVLNTLGNDVVGDAALVPSTVTIVKQPDHGTVTIDPVTGKVTYTPSLDYFGTDTYTYTVKDANGAISNVATGTITINKPPTAVNDSAKTHTNTPVVIPVLTNDVIGDAALVPSTVTIVKQPSHGTVTIDPVTGNVTYTPNTNYYGNDTLTYTIKDANGAISNVATVAIEVGRPPVTNNDNAVTNPNTPVVIDVLANDQKQDLDIAPSTVKIYKQPDHGTVTIDPVTGKVTYTPNAGYFGTDNFTYSVKDINGSESNISTVNIVVNKPPTAVNDAAITNPNTPVTLDVLANDVIGDANLAPSTVTIVKQPDHGTVSIDPVTGKVTYTPNPNYYGTDTFTYTVKDANGAISNVATGSIVINKPPTAVNDAATTNPNTPVTLNILSNDLNGDASIVPSTVTIVKQPDHGTVTVDPVTGKVTYTPNTDYYGTDNFTYTVKDANGALSNVATGTITINKPPTAVNDAATTNPNTPVTLDILANDVKGDANLVPSTVVIVKQPDHGTLSVDPVTGKVTYTPNTNYYGTDNFTYTVKDVNGAISNIATGTITINKPPTAVNDGATTNPNTPVTIDILANDVKGDANLAPSTVVIVKQPDHGTLTIDPVTGKVTYTPNPNYYGTDNFTYTVKDANGAISNVATVNIVVNKPPTAVNDAAVTNPNTPVTLDVLANDTKGDANLNPATVTIVKQPDHGTLSVDPVTGKVTYTPNKDYYGTDNFTYTVKDANGAISNVATGTITINKPPTAVNDAATTNPNTPVTLDVLANDTKGDANLTPSTVTIVKQPDHGTVTVDPVTGKVTYTPNKDYYGADNFTYTVKDANGAISNVATGTITINKPPTAVNDAATTNPSTPVTIKMLDNDVKGDANLTPSTVTIVKQPDHGTVTVDPVTGIATYTPAAGFTGNDTYTYTVKDANGAISNVATVTIHVNKPPVAVNDAATTEEPTPVTINLTGNDYSDDGVVDKTSIVAITQPAHGTIVINKDGTVVYTPNNGYVGLDNFTYTIKDNNGNTSNVATVTITVTRRKVDIGVVKKLVTPASNIQVGKDIQFEITVTNLGVKSASGVLVTDVLEATLGGVNVQLVTKTGTATYTANNKTISWLIGNMEPGASVTLTITAQVTSGGKIENSALVQSTEEDLVPENNKSTVTVLGDATKEDLFIPTVFTPNGDGRNDKFVILGLERFPGSPIMIYNRWGNMVYQSNDYKNNWDGSGLNDGTYYYVLKLNTSSGQKIYKGWVELIH
ncbi:MAG: tandem-95 repeat protein [Filimonas sp.]|nr:tandem-95 repeat protein [Filimonas sp.]